MLPKSINSYIIPKTYLEKYSDLNDDQILESFKKESQDYTDKIGNLLILPKSVN